MVAWDGEDDASHTRSPAGRPGRATDAFVPYDRCGPGMKALLLPHVDDLLDLLLQLVEPRRPDEGGSPTTGPPPLAGL